MYIYIYRISILWIIESKNIIWKLFSNTCQMPITWIQWNGKHKLESWLPIKQTFSHSLKFEAKKRCQIYLWDHDGLNYVFLFFKYNYGGRIWSSHVDVTSTFFMSILYSLWWIKLWFMTTRVIVIYFLKKKM